MPEFLSLLPPSEALGLMLRRLPTSQPDVEEIDTAAALNRILVEDIHATEALPAFTRSTVDGYAVIAADTFGASDSLPAYLALVGEAPMGSEPDFVLTHGQAAAIHTGGMLPGGADAVMMLEHTQLVRPDELEVMRPVAHLENVIRAGEDLQPGDLALSAGERLRPAEIGGLMALGLTRVRVARQPRVAVLSSGDEVTPPDVPLWPGRVRDVNSYSLSALVEQAGGIPRRYGILPDQADVLQATLGRALSDCDMVVVTAGSSASARDLTASAIQACGAPGVLVHGVNLR
ncbi:MAG: molybdopterin molybdotransferase MoeA, partial [Anaerolineaceae bacterium]|nr:molybdopterin molybdotransferase MoeA [Anaerolineaceae bacterium]